MRPCESISSIVTTARSWWMTLLLVFFASLVESTNVREFGVAANLHDDRFEVVNRDDIPDLQRIERLDRGVGIDAEHRIAVAPQRHEANGLLDFLNRRPGRGFAGYDVWSLRKNNGGLQWKGNDQCGTKRPEHDHLGCYATPFAARRRRGRSALLGACCGMSSAGSRSGDDERRFTGEGARTARRAQFGAQSPRQVPTARAASIQG